MDLIRQLQEFRLKNKISEEKLAEMLGVCFQTVNRWLNGHAKPNQINEYQIRELLKGAKK